jgi:hypothetical protein
VTFETYWGRKLLKNGALITNENLTITIESFKMELEKAYRAGQCEGLPAYKSSSPFEELFKGFGGK